ncbi:MAG: YncE family protein [Nitrososphaeraceae archaeon]|nr:YncE family protein [Nitrososphaeraceae archaeon]
MTSRSSLFCSLSVLVLFLIFVLTNNISAQEPETLSQEPQKHISLKSEPIIHAGSFPIGIAINPVAGKIYVANEYSNTISVIDIDSSAVQSNIEVDNSPYDLEINPFTNRVYSTNRGSDTVSVIDGFTDRVITKLDVGKSPVGIGINLATNWLYVSNLNSGTITVVDAIENQVTETLNYTSLPYDIVVNPQTNKVYISDLGNNSITVIDGATNKLLSKIPVGSRPSMLGFNILSNTIYVSNFLSDSISVINGYTDKVEANIKVGENPIGIIVNPKTNKVYVHNSQNKTISIIDGKTNNVIKNISLKPVLSSSITNDLLFNITSKVTLPLIASKMTIDPLTNITYMTDTISNGIIAIDGNIDELITKLFIDISPADSGIVLCNDTVLKTGEFITVPVYSQIECKADPERGYEFDFWSMNNNTYENPLKFNITGYGTLTANFKGAIFTEMIIILTSVAIGLISTIGGWLYKEKSKRFFKRHLSNIDYTYEVLSKNNREECIKQLEKIQRDINMLHRKGKFNESQLDFLEKKINWYISRIN